MSENEPVEPAGATSEDHAGVVAVPPLVYAVALLAALPAQWLMGGSTLLGGTLRVVLGAAAAVVAILVMARFVRAFDATGQDRNPNTPTPSIVSDGLYAYSRNPAYFALTLLYVGIALLLDNVWMLVFLVPVLALMHYGVILREEAYLERKFGEDYLAYKRRVRRWI